MQGHIRQRGDAWELRAYVGRDPVTHRKKYLTRTFRGGKRAVNEALAQFVTEVGGGTHAAQDATVGDLVRRWFEMAKADLSPTTVRGYARSIETYIIPILGTVPLARLRTAQLDQFYAKLRQSGARKGGPLSPASVRQVHAVVRRALTQGVKWGWIASNPAILASPPKVRRQQLDLPEPADVMKLLSNAEEADPGMGCFLRLAVTTGARRGELCGLRWKRVDLENCTIVIERSVVEAERGRIIEKDTKTHASRKISLDPVTVKSLVAHRARAAEACLQVGAPFSKSAFVFSSAADGTLPWEPSAISKSMSRLRDKAGLGYFRLHDLRHFAATRMLAGGVPVRTVSGRLGHANAVTTLGVYAHFVEASDKDAAEVLGNLLDGRSVEKPGPRKAPG